jgi:hypothetical protein
MNYCILSQDGKKFGYFYKNVKASEKSDKGGDENT